VCFEVGGSLTVSIHPATWVASSVRGARILVVDDDRAQCNRLSRICDDWGAVAFTAQTLSAALRLYGEERPDLVLLDVVMPNVDGYKLAQMFKRGGRFVPIILLTSLNDLESKRRGLAAGADEFLVKPVDAVDLQIRVSSMIRIKRLAEQLEDANARLHALASTDPLTGLLNRRVIMERLTAECSRAKRYWNRVACLMIDVDRFKQVNDTHGHPVGDRVLRRVGSIVVDTIRNSDVAGRYGGEEFLVVLPEASEGGARAAAERLRCAVAAGTGDSADMPRVTVSIGLAVNELGALSADEVIVRADAALYRAKSQGRDRVVGE
jgi:two-component system cell cycle response regulator